VIERDVGKVAVIDGDTKEGGAHGHRICRARPQGVRAPQESSDNPGRFWYTMGRDGKMTKIDLWQNPENMLVPR
jgi:nitrite reductase (NO-forming) / hydroxylamine reductase